MSLPVIPAVTKVIGDYIPPPPFATLPIGYPVTLQRDWNLRDNPYLTGVWVQYFTRPVLLGYLPDPVAIAVTRTQEVGTLVSGRMLQYMRASATLAPVITIHLRVTTPVGMS